MSFYPPPEPLSEMPDPLVCIGQCQSLCETPLWPAGKYRG